MVGGHRSVCARSRRHGGRASIRSPAASSAKRSIGDGCTRHRPHRFHDALGVRRNPGRLGNLARCGTDVATRRCPRTTHVGAGRTARSVRRRRPIGRRDSRVGRRRRSAALPAVLRHTPSGPIGRLLPSFIRCARPSLASLVSSVGFGGLADLWRIKPFATLWNELGAQFRDPRLRQLFGRYATYCGSSPFEAPATLMLIAHVEREGVWLIDGGMYQLAHALERVAKAQWCGIPIRRRSNGNPCIEWTHPRRHAESDRPIYADSIVVNADIGAIASGLFGTAVKGCVSPPPRTTRSQSAVTWSMVAETDGLPTQPPQRVLFDELSRRVRRRIHPRQVAA